MPRNYHLLFRATIAAAVLLSVGTSPRRGMHQVPGVPHLTVLVFPPDASTQLLEDDWTKLIAPNRAGPARNIRFRRGISGVHIFLCIASRNSYPTELKTLLDHANYFGHDHVALINETRGTIKVALFTRYVFQKAATRRRSQYNVCGRRQESAWATEKPGIVVVPAGEGLPAVSFGLLLFSFPITIRGKRVPGL